MGQKWHTILYMLFFYHSGITSVDLPQYPVCEPVINCHCYDIPPITGVDCVNVTNYSHLALKLRDGSLYGLNETYEIHLSGVTSIPEDAFEGLIIFQLTSESPTANISVDAFRRALRIKWLNVRQSSIEVIPNFGYISNSINIISIDGSHLTAVGKEFQNLGIEELTLRNNKISSIDPHAFKGNEVIKIIDLSGNRLETLPPHLLNNAKKLNKLVLSRNRLLHIDGLLKDTNPQIIYLDNNNLTKTDTILHHNMTNLETLFLNNNLISNLTEATFNEKIPNVRFIYLDLCLIKDFDVDHFKTLTKLAVLDLSHNLIEVIPEKVIQFGDQIQLFLNHNEIRSFKAEINYVVKRLFLNGNKLKSLEKFLHMTQLAEVEIMDNLLEALEEDDLRSVHGTEVLMLNDNKIKRVGTLFFSPIKNDLEFLDISKNQIPALNGSVKFLSKLKSLNASYNQLTSFEEGEFVGLNELSELYMQNNRILALGGQLHRVPQLRFLLVKDNWISTIEKGQIPKSLTYLYYSGNPIVCDCRLLPFLEWLDQRHSSESLETDFQFCRPINNITNNYKALKPVSPFPEWKCPGPCSCFCSKDVNDTFIALDCRGQNLSQIPPMLRQYETNSSEYSAEKLLLVLTIKGMI